MFWLGLALFLSIPVGFSLTLVGLYFYLCYRFLDQMVRIFEEKPLFIIPRGQPFPQAEDLRFPTTDGLFLSGCYLKTSLPRKGVVLFGLEFGSNRWSCVAYSEHLLQAGYDVFAFESRNQGDSDFQAGYEPMQWVTEHEVADTKAALAYLKQRPDADPRGIGFFGISKGGGAGLQVAAFDSYIRCCATDGVFAVYTTLVPYMRHWYRIYSQDFLLQGLLPSWYYGVVGMTALRRIEKKRGCRFVHLHKVLKHLAPRPLLMIHGASDTYIKPEMTQALFASAGTPKELWIVEQAKHNQALHIAGDEYRRRVLAFFDTHLAK